MNTRTWFFVSALAAIVVAGSAIYLLRVQPQGANAAAPTGSVDSSARIPPDTEADNIKRAAEQHPRHSQAQPPVQQSKYKLERGLEGFLREYPALVARANKGDAGAARQLYENLSQCAGTPSSPAALDDFEKEAAADYGVDSPKYNDAVTFANRRYSSCSQLSAAQIADYKKWLALAASAGDHEARLAYVRNGQPDPNSTTYFQETRAYKDTAKRYLEEEIASGNSKALFVASISYTQDGVFGSNVVKQYAYLYAYALAENITQGAIFDHLKMLSGAISESDLATATEQGESIYRKCCLN